MKVLAFLTFILINTAFAFDAKVISAQIGIEDSTGSQSLCLTLVEDEHNVRIAIYEDIYDCYYTRKAAKNIGDYIEIDREYLEPPLPEDGIPEILKNEFVIFYSIVG